MDESPLKATRDKGSGVDLDKEVIRSDSIFHVYEFSFGSTTMYLASPYDDELFGGDSGYDLGRWKGGPHLRL